MRRRELLKYAGATALAAPFIRTARADTGTVKIGVVGAKTGPLAPGAAITLCAIAINWLIYALLALALWASVRSIFARRSRSGA